MNGRYLWNEWTIYIYMKWIDDIYIYKRINNDIEWFTNLYMRELFGKSEFTLIPNNDTTFEELKTVIEDRRSSHRMGVLLLRPMMGVATLKGLRWCPFGWSVDLYGFDFRSDPEHKFINGMYVWRCSPLYYIRWSLSIYICLVVNTLLWDVRA